MAWRWVEFDEMSAGELYEALRLRQDVFIIEQECIYPELDGVDQASLHLLVRGDDRALVGTLRVVPPGARYEEPSIGRIVVRADARGAGLARRMMAEAVAKCRALYPGRTIKIQAQQYLEGFYGSMGFRTITEPYDEAGIMHVDMVLEG